jgi:predicted enzyme related to lactoylglutathione lyase
LKPFRDGAAKRPERSNKEQSRKPERIESLGGKQVRGKQPVGAIGFAAYFTDTEGSIVGLWQSA